MASDRFIFQEKRWCCVDGEEKHETVVSNELGSNFHREETTS